MTIIQSNAPSSRAADEEGGGVVELPTRSVADLILLNTPTNQGGLPLNPFADEISVCVSNNLLLRRPGSSPQPAGHNMTKPADPAVLRPSITVDAILNTSTAPVTKFHTTPSENPSRTTQWIRNIARKHPVKLLNYFRLGFLLPLLAYLTIAALNGSDWRHNEFRLDAEGSSRTLLSLSGVERVVKTSGLGGAGAMLSELSVGYASILQANSGECEMDAQVASSFLADKPLDVTKVNTDRNYRLAVFGVLYGPSYRDVDCRALAKFRSVGLSVKIILILVTLLMFLQWVLSLVHICSNTLAEEATLAYDHCVQVSNRAAFMVPANTTEWVPIDMSRYVASTAHTAPSRPMLSKLTWVNRIWWNPLTSLLKNSPSSISASLKWYPLWSFLEGGSLLFSAVYFTLFLTALLIWFHQTDQPACLNAGAELQSCQVGASFSLAVFAAILSLVTLLSSVLSGRITHRIDKLYASSAGESAASAWGR